VLQTVQFTRLSNASVDLTGQPTVTAPTTIALPAGTAQVTLLVRRVSPGQASTVEGVVTDVCGAWPTFFGGGPSAF
jgi:hypothetical protein